MDCQLLKNVLRSRSQFKVLASAVSQMEILDSMQAHPLDVALISENLQDGPLTGFRVLPELRTSFPGTRVVMLLKSGTQEMIVDAFRAGVKGVFCRADPVKNLGKCIDAVHNGQIWANSTQLHQVLDAFMNTAPLRIVDFRGRNLLSKREDDVVRQVVDGNSNREIALKLNLTEHTVSNYLFRIYEKLGISSRVELVLYSLKRPQT